MKNRKQKGVVAESIVLALIAASVILAGAAGVVITEAVSITAGVMIGKVAANAERKKQNCKVRYVAKEQRVVTKNN
jgi:general stress protein CsbA